MEGSSRFWTQICDSGRQRWSKIQKEVFGAIFEGPNLGLNGCCPFFSCLEIFEESTSAFLKIFCESRKRSSWQRKRKRGYRSTEHLPHFLCQLLRFSFRPFIFREYTSIFWILETSEPSLENGSPEHWKDYGEGGAKNMEFSVVAIETPFSKTGATTSGALSSPTSTEMRPYPESFHSFGAKHEQSPKPTITPS